ncbi:non-ribosomal peptide synthetase [Catellatospora tritici]|uniref:non-ribosomal peptide synthetase n=1 Tax=Catellatospora tritici TaxID=2851566 RepID=UPI001C2D654D|nr:non-ribosomal peptide synthetase [Catellatospora tritici]MBV1856200.1 amino acid adenylation domain-containing protein [Catellatospora tritici]
MPESEEGLLTAAQQRLWFLDRLDPGDAAYHISTTSRLRGPLDRDLLTRAYDDATRRHESLRTRFGDHHGVPYQQVQPPRHTPIEYADLSAATDPRAAARVRVEELIARPFDLAQGHLIRIGLLRLSDDEHVLCTVVHHIVGDGWSMNLLYRQITESYRGLEPTAPAVRYLDHAAARAADPTTGLDFWAGVLADPPTLDLPLDRPRPPVRTSAGGVVLREFPGDTLRAVQAATRQLRCTPYMLLVTLYELALAQLSGQDDLTVGTPVAGRDDTALEAVFGYFSGMLVLRADLSGDVTFRDLVLRTRRSFMEAFAHQDIPFEELTARLNLPRDLSRNALFQATFTLHTTMNVSATATDGFGGLAAEAFDSGTPHVKTDVAMDVQLGADAMDVVLTYNSDLFEPATAHALADRFTALLHAVLAEPDARVRELPLVDDGTRAELLRLGTGPDLAPQAPLLARIERVVASTPDAVALRSGNDTVTYRGLWTRSGELADALRAAGVSAGALVGVSVPRGPELVASLLAVWRAGCGYVPIDPGLPAARRDAMVAQAAVAAVLGPDGVAPAATEPAAVPAAAYVLFTSGSTGTPKAVLVGRQALDDRTGWMAADYGLTAADRVVQFAGVGFDTHAEEIWPTLAVGGTLVLLPDGPQSLPELLAADPAVTVLDLPTAYWQALLDVVPAWPAALRLVILGGEQVAAAAVATWRDRHGDRVRLVNTYGPTEATIIATAADLGAADTRRRPPIGRPLAGVRAYVLDRFGRLVPPGAAGELCLAGAGLAEGYLGRPDLTAERFGSDPYGPGLMYRTGDRVRWRRDEPVLEFLGRVDRQLKVRGVRIEPGEVEAVLTGHPDVGQAAVVAVDDTLVGYVTGPVCAEEVRAFAAERLPALLVPSVIVVLAELPLTRNGKVDLRALPPVTIGDEARADYVAPRTDAEALVAGIFAELLPIERAGAHDDFFALGGHSLLATRVIARLRATVDLDLPIRSLFDRPTVAGFADAVEQALVAEIDRLTEEEAAAQLAAAGQGAP